MFKDIETKFILTCLNGVNFDKLEKLLKIILLMLELCYWIEK